MMKTGQIERTNDRDFETELRRYRTMETAANKLQKEAKGYLDSLRGMGIQLEVCCLKGEADTIHSNDRLTAAHRRNN